jgi:Repeat of unknown function (DUF5648)
MHRTTTQRSKRRAARWIAGVAMALTSGVAIAVSVVEFYNTNLDTYFLTADPNEAAAIDSGAAGPGWSRTGSNFNAGGPTPVCRFYGSLVPGPNSHFYTALADECAALKQLQAVTPPSQKRWNFESLDFATTVPAGGVCPADTRAVYRAYNNGFTRGIDSNHRITTSLAGIQQVVARGWGNEGVVMCAPSAVPQAGWWWNPAENGRWFFLESGNTDTQLAGYFYAGDGRATWLSSVGPNADPYSYSGRLLGYRDGQTLFGDYKPPAAPTDAGSVALTFSNDTHAGLTWPGGVVPLERASFGTGAAPFQPDTGWWSNPDENGRAYSIEVQGDSLFAGAYMYDDSGNPVWYYSSGKMATPTTYEGQWLQSANGQTLAGPWQPHGAPIPVGGLSIEFTAIDEASLTFTENAAAVAARAQPKRIKTITVKRNRPVKPNTLPARFDGNFTQTHFDEHTIAAGVRGTTTTTVKGNLTWELPDGNDLAFLPTLKRPQAFYKPTGAEKPLTLDLDITLAGPGQTCNGKIEGLQLPLPPSASGSSLEVNGYGQYRLKMDFTAYSGSFTGVCRDEHGQESEVQIPALVPVAFNFEGTMVYGVTGGGRSETTIGTDHITVTSRFSFAAASAN